jgi:hypothetical protein
MSSIRRWTAEKLQYKPEVMLKDSGEWKTMIGTELGTTHLKVHFAWN